KAMELQNGFHGNTPKVSIIIPTYKGEDDITHAIDTALGQTYPNLEIVIVNDGSPDNTSEVVDDHIAGLSEGNRARIIYIEQDNQGVSAARNNGVVSSSGEFIALLDDDDSWHPDKIAEQVEKILRSENPNNTLCVTDTKIVRSDGSSELKETGPSLNFQQQLERAWFPNPSSWMMSRSMYDRLGGFDERMSAGEDSDLHFLIRKKGYDIVNVDQPLTTYHWPHQSDIGEQRYKGIADSHALRLEKHGEWLFAQMTPAQRVRSEYWHRQVIGDERFDQIMNTGTQERAPKAKSDGLVV
ncbi:MAG: glycosyltransferase family A protein, partial [Pseudomonadota bacterium]